jgi:hypothetical protein
MISTYQFFFKTILGAKPPAAFNHFLGKKLMRWPNCKEQVA